MTASSGDGGIMLTAGGNGNLCKTCGNSVWNFFKTLKNRATIWPTYSTLEYAQRTCKAILQRLLLIATLSIVAKRWSTQPRYPLTDDWLKYDTHTMELYGAIKKNKTRIFVGKWMQLGITLSKWARFRKKANTYFLVSMGLGMTMGQMSQEFSADYGIRLS